MIREEIFGRDEGSIKKFQRKGCGYLGKIVTYPAGKYEEGGAVYLDITSPHCMLVVGKRGTGKSYTLGVLAEAFAMLEDAYRKRIALIIIDTMSVFHSLKSINTNDIEVGRLKDFQDLEPKAFDESTKIFMPKITIERLEQEGEKVTYDEVLQIPLKEVTSHDWLNLFGLKPTEPAGVLLVRILDRLGRSEDAYGYEEIYREIEQERAETHVKDGLKNLFGMIERLKVFDRLGTDYDALVKGGQISVLDISYLGRIGGFDVRNLVIAIIGRRLLSERTLYSTIEMQAEANIIDGGVSKSIAEEHPLVYMMIDEAHLFLPTNYSTLSSDVLIDWIKLGRHPGLSLVLATQEPSALHESAIRQSDIILAHNVTSNDDIIALGKAKQSFMTGTKDFQKLVSTMEFKRGLAVLFDDKTRKMEMIRIRPRLSLHAGMDASAMRGEKVVLKVGRG